MRWTNNAVTAFFLVCAPPATADALPLCPGQLVDGTGSDEAQATWLLATDYALAEAGILTATALLPHVLANGAECLAVQFLEDFSRQPDGTVIAQVVPTSRIYGVLEPEAVTVTTDSILDWSYIAKPSGPVYGKYSLRAMDQTQRILDYPNLTLSDAPLPPGWNP